MSAPAKVVLVSGGTFGIGRAITLGLARRGHSVVAFGLEAPQVSSTAQNAIPSLRDELDREGLSVELMEATTGYVILAHQDEEHRARTLAEWKRLTRDDPPGPEPNRPRPGGTRRVQGRRRDRPLGREPTTMSHCGLN